MLDGDYSNYYIGVEIVLTKSHFMRMLKSKTTKPKNINRILFSADMLDSDSTKITKNTKMFLGLV